MGDLRLETLGANNIVAANALTLKGRQQQFITPVSYGVATAMIDHNQVWSQVIKDDQEVVGFISCSFDSHHELSEFRSCILRIHVDAERQRQGIGRFAIEKAVKEARNRHKKELYVIWEPGSDGPEMFFQRMGFVVKKQTQYSERVGCLDINN